MATVELQEGEKIYLQSEIEELFSRLGEAETNLVASTAKSNEQKILINQSIKVFQMIEKLFPGLTNGKGFGPGDIMNVTKLIQNNKGFLADLEQLKKCIDIYTSKNPVIKVA